MSKQLTLNWLRELRDLVYDLNRKFITETGIENLSKVFSLCFIKSVFSKKTKQTNEQKKNINIFIRMKNHVIMKMPIDSFVIITIKR